LKRLLYPVKYRDEMVKIDHNPAGHVHQFRKLMSGASSKAPDVQVKASDPASFQFTGGTTGIPKAAVLTHRNLVANSIQARAWLTGIRDGEEVVMAVLPFFHAYGGTLCLYLGTVIAATIVLVPRFDITDVMELIGKYQPTIFPGVPTLYSALNGAIKDNSERQTAMRSIRLCVSGGAPLPSDVRQRFEEVTGGKLVEGFGLSEASPITHVNPLDGRSREGSIGLPVPSTEVMLVDLETREPLSLNGRGELVLRGPQVMQGYWGRPDETAEVLSKDGWLYTGDIATMDEDGFFRIVDRQKDVIITGGENVYPREIEEVLYSHPAIREVCVAAVDHQVGGQVAKAFIVLEPGETLTRKDVLQYTSERLAKYKVPRLIEFRESLPKSAAGKILRRQLQEEEKAKNAQRGSRRRQATAAEPDDDELLTPPEAEAQDVPTTAAVTEQPSTPSS
jgi:long-chain acyl-CoA synthetase